MLWKIHGNWNSKIFVSPYGTDGKVDESRAELIFEKYPYPDKWDYQYGMSHYSMQLNYFPSWLDEHLPPTDTRRRPDQRLLESGDMVKAAKEKERLEIKQRTVRKWRETNDIEQKPAYFKEWMNPEDG